MNRRLLVAFVLVAGMATAPAAYGQDHPSRGTETDTPAQPGRMQMHEGQSMMRQGGMRGMTMGAGPMMILGQRQALAGC